MANILLTIQHNGNVFSPPIEEGVQIEWERTGSPGKLTFTTIKVHQTDMSFQEGDPVCFYYDDKLVFKGYVFKKKRDREHHIKVTCYDQIRYLKNKYTYVFENKTATQIITALCEDFSLQTGNMDNTNYVIPAVAEENIAALDIVLDVLEETLLNTGNRFVFYDDAGKLTVKNCANMVSNTLIMNETAENFDYTSSIDDETYNNIVLYYKNDDNSLVLYTASSPSTVKQWGVLRYFEETDTPTVGQNKANALLQLYNNKTRELKVSGAFGDISVRGGTLIPVKLDLGDINTNYYMLVEKVTHNFDKDHHTMDLTLESAWDDKETTDTVSKQFGEVKITKTTTGGTYGGTPSFEVESTNEADTSNSVVNGTVIASAAGVHGVNSILNGKIPKQKVKITHTGAKGSRTDAEFYIKGTYDGQETGLSRMPICDRSLTLDKNSDLIIDLWHKADARSWGVTIDDYYTVTVSNALGQVYSRFASEKSKEGIRRYRYIIKNINSNLDIIVHWHES